jgi:hypothetical protein
VWGETVIAFRENGDSVLCRMRHLSVQPSKCPRHHDAYTSSCEPDTVNAPCTAGALPESLDQKGLSLLLGEQLTSFMLLADRYVKRHLLVHTANAPLA